MIKRERKDHHFVIKKKHHLKIAKKMQFLFHDKSVLRKFLKNTVSFEQKKLQYRLT